MPQLQITVEQDKFTAAITKSKRSALGKRGISGGVLVDVSKIPANVVTALLFQAIETHMQTGLKALNAETATQAECQAAMKARVELLYSGSLTAAGGRKAPTRDPIKAAAKLSVKTAIQERSDEKLDGKTLTKMVSDLFKLHDQWVKDGSKADSKYAKPAALVAAALKAAKEAHDAQQDMNESLAQLAETAKKKSAEAKAAKAAAAAEAGEGGAEAEDAEARPTPTQTVKRQKTKPATQSR